MCNVVIYSGKIFTTPPHSTPDFQSVKKCFHIIIENRIGKNVLLRRNQVRKLPITLRGREKCFFFLEPPSYLYGSLSERGGRKDFFVVDKCDDDGRIRNLLLFLFTEEAVESVDVVIIFSRNCVVASQWVPYLTELLNQLFRETGRPQTRITSRDVESLVSCNGSGIQHPDGRAFERCDYQNDAAAELLEMEQNSQQRSVRKTVSTASLQIVLLTKALLSHVGLHANDPLGGLLNAKRVIGLLLGLDERKDITQLHISGMFIISNDP